VMTLFNGPAPVQSKLNLTAAAREVKFTDKYAPTTLAEVLGQDHATTPLRGFLASPYPCAILLSGPTGAGKSSTAQALVNDLRVDRAANFYHFKSGVMDAEAVETLMRDMRYVPWGGGWRAVLVDEADLWTVKARQLWLSILEDLPRNTVVVFTTNHREAFDQRTLDRFQFDLQFTADGPVSLDAAQALADHIWEAETGGSDGPDVARLPNVVLDGQVSYRRLVTAMQAVVRDGVRLAPPERVFEIPLDLSALGLMPVCGGAPEGETPAPVFPEEDWRDEMRQIQDRFLALPWVKAAIKNSGEDVALTGNCTCTARNLRSQLFPKLKGILLDSLAEHEADGNPPIEAPTPEPIPAPKPKKKRRTKAEMERDKTLEAIGLALKEGRTVPTFEDLRVGLQVAIHKGTKTGLFTVTAIGGGIVTVHQAEGPAGFLVDGDTEVFETITVREADLYPAPEPPASPQDDRGEGTADRPGEAACVPCEASGVVCEAIDPLPVFLEENDDRPIPGQGRIHGVLSGAAPSPEPSVRDDLQPGRDAETDSRPVHRGSDRESMPAGRPALAPVFLPEEHPGAAAGLELRAPAAERLQALHQLWLSGLTANTRRAYAGDLEDFARFLGFDGSERWGGVGDAIPIIFSSDAGYANTIVLNYRNRMVENGLAPATIGRRIAAIKSLGKLARLIGAVSWSIEVDGPRVETLRDTAGPGARGWAKMRAAALADESPRGRRDAAIVCLLRDLGLRRNELASLDLEHVRLADGMPDGLWFLGKGRGDRGFLTVPGATGAVLRSWLEQRGSSPGPLFYRLDNAADPAGPKTRLTGEAIRLLVARAGNNAGLERGVRPHGLRHEGITAVLDANGGDLRAAARFSRHKNIQTIVRYDDNRTNIGGRMAELIAGT
jgi:integrase/recombinase XerC